jgi:type II secretory pathway pseudopilin PulG
MISSILKTRVFTMKKKSVVWVSTVLYILIGLAIMGLLLAVMRPKIAETKDAFIIDQTIQSLDTLDSKIIEVQTATGNLRSYKLGLTKGYLTIDGKNEKIYWNALSNYQYSEANKTISIGKIDALTMPSANLWDVTLTLNYKENSLNFTIAGNDDLKTLSPASLPYTVWIKNNGTKEGKQQIDFTVE